MLCCWCGLCSVGLHLLSAVGVRMARIGFSAIDIYLYTDGVARDCGAFSCLCGGVGGLCCYVYGCMQGLFRVVWCWYGVYMYLCIMCLWLVWWWCGAGGLFVCMDR